MWLQEINGNHTRGPHKLCTYCKFQNSFEMENYLKLGISVQDRNNFNKLRISAHTLQIETGRYTRPKTPIDQRTCQVCNTKAIEDKIHFATGCNEYHEIRNTLYSDLAANFKQFTVLGDLDKFTYKMSLGDGKRSTCHSIYHL